VTAVAQCLEEIRHNIITLECNIKPEAVVFIYSMVSENLKHTEILQMKDIERGYAVA
jgi:hypothetical protein